MNLLQSKRGARPKDSSYLDEMERQRLAEERRRRAQEMYDKLRKHRHEEDEDIEDTVQFEDCKLTDYLNHLIWSQHF